jgi:hypothetical protein
VTGANAPTLHPEPQRPSDWAGNPTTACSASPDGQSLNNRRTRTLSCVLSDTGVLPQHRLPHFAIALRRYDTSWEMPPAQGTTGRSNDRIKKFLLQVRGFRRTDLYLHTSQLQ